MNSKAFDQWTGHVTPLWTVRYGIKQLEGRRTLYEVKIAKSCLACVILISSKPSADHLEDYVTDLLQGLIRLCADELIID